MERPRSRRSVLRGVVVVGLPASLAGCAETGETPEEELPEEPSAQTDGELDLAQVNVVEVDVVPLGGTDYRFDVRVVYDPDAGEDGDEEFWWQVEDPAGQGLARRSLPDDEGADGVITAASVTVPSHVECVVVRGRHAAAGYGGQVALVSVPSGATELRRQGPTPQGFQNVTCP